MPPRITPEIIAELSKLLSGSAETGKVGEGVMSGWVKHLQDNPGLAEYLQQGRKASNIPPTAVGGFSITDALQGLMEKFTEAGGKPELLRSAEETMRDIIKAAIPSHRMERGTVESGRGLVRDKVTPTPRDPAQAAEFLRQQKPDASILETALVQSLARGKNIGGASQELNVHPGVLRGIFDRLANVVGSKPTQEPPTVMGPRSPMGKKAPPGTARAMSSSPGWISRLLGFGEGGEAAGSQLSLPGMESLTGGPKRGPGIPGAGTLSDIADRVFQAYQQLVRGRQGPYGVEPPWPMNQLPPDVPPGQMSLPGMTGLPYTNPTLPRSLLHRPSLRRED